MFTNSANPAILHFELFKQFKNITDFSTTRQGGCSTGNFDAFNLSYYSGDLKKNVDKNRRKLCKDLHLIENNLFVPYQTHHSEIVIIDDDFLQSKKEDQEIKLQGKDALITSLKNVSIAITTADCVPIILYAADKNVIGAVHAGWRGTVSYILKKTIQTMINHYHCNPDCIYAAIGPSISPAVFETGDEVYLTFKDAGFDMPSISFKHPDTRKYHINLWEANKQQLMASNIPENQIEIAGICTYSESEQFFSARKLSITSGRMLTGICML